MPVTPAEPIGMSIPADDAGLRDWGVAGGEWERVEFRSLSSSTCRTRRSGTVFGSLFTTGFGGSATGSGIASFFGAGGCGARCERCDACGAIARHRRELDVQRRNLLRRGGVHRGVDDAGRDRRRGGARRRRCRPRRRRRGGRARPADHRRGRPSLSFGCVTIPSCSTPARFMMSSTATTRPYGTALSASSSARFTRRARSIGPRL